MSCKPLKLRDNTAFIFSAFLNQFHNMHIKYILTHIPTKQV